ncbi:MAG: hypothetical protein ACI35O_16525 [Bacillaceae bacterium]
MATKEQRQSKNFAEKLLQIQGIDYDTWLDEKHQEVIQNNQALILEALDNKLNVRTSVEGPTKPISESKPVDSNSDMFK